MTNIHVTIRKRSEGDFDVETVGTTDLIASVEKYPTLVMPCNLQEQDEATTTALVNHAVHGVNAMAPF